MPTFAHKYVEQDRQSTYKSNIEARSRNHCCRDKVVLRILSASVALAIQHAKRMRRITLSSAACLSIPNFSTLAHTRQAFWKKLADIKCVLIFPTTFFQNISHSRKNSVRYYHSRTQVFMSSTRYSCQILMKLEFPRQIFKK
jgi:hypothetical protein